MKKRFTDEQIIGFLKQADGGVPVRELCRQHGFSDASFYTWRAKFGGMTIPDAKRLRDLEAENTQLKKLLAESLLDAEALKVALGRKPLTPQAKREAVTAMLEQTEISERRACLLVELSRTVLHYAPKVQPENEQLQGRMIELATKRRRFGYRRLHALLRREGIDVNHKRIFRLYQAAGLAVKRRRKRCNVTVEREQLALPSRPNEVWSMDFISDALANGRRIKVLTIVDDFTKESVDLVAEHGISGQYVVRVLERASQFRGLPLAIRTDQGPEFTSKALDQWAYQNGVQLKLIEPGKPTQNACIESFNGRFRDECLNDHWFTSLAEARIRISSWRRDYNENRPHSALEYRTPAEFAASCRMHQEINSHERDKN
nr:IS3 family transposase [Nitrosospira sp. Nl5]